VQIFGLKNHNLKPGRVRSSPNGGDGRQSTSTFPELIFIATVPISFPIVKATGVMPYMDSTVFIINIFVANYPQMANDSLYLSIWYQNQKCIIPLYYPIENHLHLTSV